MYMQFSCLSVQCHELNAGMQGRGHEFGIHLTAAACMPMAILIFHTGLNDLVLTVTLCFVMELYTFT